MTTEQLTNRMALDAMNQLDLFTVARTRLNSIWDTRQALGRNGIGESDEAILHDNWESYEEVANRLIGI